MKRGALHMKATLSAAQLCDGDGGAEWTPNGVVVLSLRIDHFYWEVEREGTVSAGVCIVEMDSQDNNEVITLWASSDFFTDKDDIVSLGKKSSLSKERSTEFPLDNDSTWREGYLLNALGVLDATQPDSVGGWEQLVNCEMLVEGGCWVE
jgi:hypothetical protein